MASIAIENKDYQWVVSNKTVTCAGTVKAPHGASIVRKVVAFADNNPNVVLAITESARTYGTFSMTLSGHNTTEFTIVAKGEYGENDSVYANANVNGTGPTGLYIAPPLNNLPFIVGPGDVTSPFVDILFPIPIIEAVGDAEIIAWGEIQIPYSVEAVGDTPIVSWGACSFGYAETYGVADVFYETDADISFPAPQVDAEASTSYYSWGNVVTPGLRVNGETSPFADIVFPMPQVSCDVINPIITVGEISFITSVVKSVGETGALSFGDTVFPLPVVAGYSTVNDIAIGNVSMPVFSMSAIAHTEITVQGEISIPVFEALSYAGSTHAFEPLAYAPDCGLTPPIAYGNINFPILEFEGVA